MSRIVTHGRRATGAEIAEHLTRTEYNFISDWRAPENEMGMVQAFERAYGSIGGIERDVQAKRFVCERYLDNQYANANNLPEHRTVAQDYARRWKERMPSQSQRWNLIRNLDACRLQAEKRKDIEGFLNELILEQYTFAHRAVDPHFTYSWGDRTFKLHCHAVTDNHGVFPHQHVALVSITYEAVASAWDFAEGRLRGTVKEQEVIWHELHKLIHQGVTESLQVLEPQWHDSEAGYY